jgi:2-keto-4-pentenoate hydratase/2-oxohepta-3-ene-1,7-dioic acid hydratase in catechol pathway
MRLARCIDDQGRILWVDPLGADSAVPYQGGNPFAGLRPGQGAVSVTRWLAPVEPTVIFGVGLNYRAHAAETGAALPEMPVLFMKPNTAVTAPGEPIVLPAACEHGPEVDYEAELAVVIGKTARNVPAERALHYVLGYTCANDVSARRWQKHAGGGQWVRGKSFDTFCPLGPVLVTADEIPDPQALPIRSVLNGQTMQSSSTADMIFPVAELIAFISRDTTLLPGSVILTGTPEGVGFARQPPVFLAEGDTIEITIDGIGTLSNPVQDALAQARE